MAPAGNEEDSDHARGSEGSEMTHDSILGSGLDLTDGNLWFGARCGQ